MRVPTTAVLFKGLILLAACLALPAGAAARKVVKPKVSATASASAVAVAPTPARQDGVEVHISLLQAGKLELSYQLPPGCPMLPLRSGPWTLKQQREWRAEWVALDDCSSMTDAGVSRRSAECSVLRFAVPAVASVQDRQYPPAYPVGEQGIYLHTGSFAPDTHSDASCGPVTWRFGAPNGSVVFDGQAYAQEFTLPESAAPALSYSAVYLSQEPLANGSDAITVFAPELPGWLRGGLTEASSGIVQHYRQSFPQISFPQPALFATHVRDDRGPRFQADVAQGRMMRFAFYNVSDDLDFKRLQSARSTVAHEYAHVLQSGLQAPGFAYAERTVMAEGGAEFLRWISEYRLGWKNGAQLAAELDDALNLCLMDIGDMPWKQVMKRNAGRTPYQCGLAIHVLTLAARKSPEKADTVLVNYYAAVRRDPKADIAQGIECGTTLGCRAHILPDLLGSKAGFASQIAGLLNSLGVVRKNDVQPTPATKTFYASVSFAQLMAEDCSGVGFWTRESYFEVDRITSCKSLQVGMKINRAEGIPLFDESQLAAQAIATACEKTGSTTLQTVDGQSVRVACRHPYRPAKNFYKLDTGKILTLLEAR
jgi:hypothetical protein